MKRNRSKQVDKTAPPKRSKQWKPNLNDLPEDALHELFKRVPSLPDRFSVAGVNQKFRRCMLKQIKKTTSLSLDVTPSLWLLNGHRIPPKKWPRAVGVLLEVAELKEISIVKSSELSYAIYTALLSSRPSLRKLTKFESEARCTSPWLPGRIIRLLQNSPKLSVLKLDLVSYELRKLKLTQTLTNRAFTEIDLRLNCRSKELVELFQALQPNTLKKVGLDIYLDAQSLVKPWPPESSPAEITGIFEKLRTDIWAAVEFISFVKRRHYGPDSTTAADSLFQVLAQFPLLQRCIYALDCPLYDDKLLNNVITYLRAAAASSHKRVFVCNNVLRPGDTPTVDPHGAIAW